MASIRKRGNTWQCIVRVTQDGQDFEESRTFDTERLAKDWGKRIEADIKLNGIQHRTRSGITLGKLLEDYLNAITALRPARRQTVHDITRLAYEFRNDKLPTLTSKRFMDFGLSRAKGGASGATVLHDLSTLRSVIGAAKPMFGVNIKTDAIDEATNSLRRIGAVAKSKSRHRRPTSDELKALTVEFERIGRHPATIIPMNTILQVAILFPRRLGEITSMTWEDYRGTHITLRDTKHPVAPRTEVVPVPEDAAAIFDALPRIDARILPYNSESVSASFERACKRLEIMDLRFHDLRHEGITRLFDAGLSIPEVAMISGHKSWGMLKRYTHMSPKSVADKLRGRSRLTEWTDTL